METKPFVLRNAVMTAEILERLPDVPAWVELRTELLHGDAEALVSTNGLVVITSDPYVFVVGSPAREHLEQAATRVPDAELIVREPQLIGLEPLQLRRIVVHTATGPFAQPLHAARALAPSDSLAHLEEELRKELEAALQEGPVMATFDGEHPVSFCYAGAITERFWDVAIDTAPTHQRQGRAAAAFVAVASRHPTRIPVWQAEVGNPPSMLLAKKLGFAPVDEVYIGAASLLR